MMLLNLSLESLRMRYVIHTSSGCGDVWKMYICMGYFVGDSW